VSSFTELSGPRCGGDQRIEWHRRADRAGARRTRRNRRPPLTAERFRSVGALARAAGKDFALQMGYRVGSVPSTARPHAARALSEGMALTRCA
jgi:hypothetical protein